MSVELLACTSRCGLAGGAVGLVKATGTPVAPMTLTPVCTAEPIVPFTWPLESTIVCAPGPSFISQSASVAADAGAAKTTATTTAAVRDLSESVPHHRHLPLPLGFAWDSTRTRHGR